MNIALIISECKFEKEKEYLYSNPFQTQMVVRATKALA